MSKLFPRRASVILGTVALFSLLFMLAPAGWVPDWIFTGGRLTLVVAAGAIALVLLRAGVSEFMTGWAGARTGAAAGLVIGVAAAALAERLPWIASRDPYWPLVTIVAAGALAGAIAGACYVRLRRSWRRTSSTQFRQRFRRSA
jgi:hypothetical protein